MQQVLAATKLRKLEKRKFTQTNPLPDFFHYEGEAPRVKRNSDGAIITFSTPIKVWIDNDDNYSHLYYRSKEHSFHRAVPGYGYSNAPTDRRNGNILKHVHSKNPELCAYDDLPDWYKIMKTKEWESGAVVASSAHIVKTPSKVP